VNPVRARKIRKAHFERRNVFEGPGPDRHAGPSFVWCLRLDGGRMGIEVGSLASALAAFLGICLTMLATVYQQRIRKRTDDLEIDLFRSYKAFMDVLSKKTNGPSLTLSYDKLLENIVSSSIFPGITRQHVEEGLERTLTLLRERVEKIEKRFPPESSLEKISSINDAILATNLESLVERVSKLEKAQLTRWDVVKVCFAIMGAFGALLSVILAVARSVSSPS
jgi:hypothetical protein